MALGYDGKLYILAFDHRGSFQKKMFGIAGDPTPEETATIADAKQLIYEGMALAVDAAPRPSATGVLVDEQFGGDSRGERRRRASSSRCRSRRAVRTSSTSSTATTSAPTSSSSTRTSARCSCATTRTPTRP